MDILTKADLVLDSEDFIVDNKTGDILVPDDLFDSYIQGTYLSVAYAHENQDTVYEYKMIDHQAGYIRLEYIGG